MKRLRICMLSTFYPPWSFGGDAIFVQRLAKALVRRGHEVQAVYNLDAYRTLGGKPTAPAEGAIASHGLRSRWPKAALLAAHQSGRPGPYRAQLRRILDRGGFDVVHFHNISLMGGPGVLRLGGRALRLYTLHEHWLVCPTHALWKFNRRPCRKKNCLPCQIHAGRPPQLWRWTRLRDRTLSHVDAVLCPSRSSLQRHRREGVAGRLLHLPHFQPETPLAEKKDAPGYFLFAGRLEKLKGVQTLLPHFRGSDGPMLWVAGQGEYGEQLRRKAQGSPRIRFLGRRRQHELASLYRNALATVIPSLCEEVFGMVALESFAQGTPVVARRRGALTEVVEQSGGGLLYSSPQELDRALRDLESDAGRRSRLGGRGRRAIQELWSEEKHIDAYLRLIRRLKEGVKT